MAYTSPEYEGTMMSLRLSPSTSIRRGVAIKGEFRRLDDHSELNSNLEQLVKRNAKKDHVWKYVKYDLVLALY